MLLNCFSKVSSGTHQQSGSRQIQQSQLSADSSRLCPEVFPTVKRTSILFSHGGSGGGNGGGSGGGVSSGSHHGKGTKRKRGKKGKVGNDNRTTKYYNGGKKY